MSVRLHNVKGLRSDPLNNNYPMYIKKVLNLLSETIRELKYKFPFMLTENFLRPEDDHLLHMKYVFSNYIVHIAKFHQGSSARTREMPNYRIFQIIRQYLYWPKFLQVIFLLLLLHLGCTTREIFHLNINFICWIRVIRRYHNGWCTQTYLGPV